MGAETDRFIIAAAALWAGDGGYFRELVKGTPYAAEVLQRTADSPESIIATTAALRLRQLSQKRAEFMRLERGGLVDEPLVLRTSHLRATIWRTGSREFALLGYLSFLDYEKELFERVHREREDITPLPQDRLEQEDLPGAPNTAAVRPLGGVWVKAGNPFLQIEVGDMGLIEATATWTEKALPPNVEAISRPFYELLHSLDPIKRADVRDVKDE